MKNREKFAKEILDIACKGDIIEVTKDNKVVCCNDIGCNLCRFAYCNIGDKKCSTSCYDRLHEWAESEYIEKPTITSKEKMLLDLLLSKWNFLARDADGKLFVYESIYKKDIYSWFGSGSFRGLTGLFGICLILSSGKMKNLGALKI